MKRFLLLFAFLLSFGAVAQRKKSVPAPKCIQLFNGKDLKDWKVKINGYPLGDNYANTFRVTDGKLAVGYEKYDAFNDRFGHMFYKKKFSYYLLSLEYRFVGEQVKGGPGWAYRNSGAMLHGQAPETMGLNQDFPISLEMQLLGGNGKDERHTANLCTPGTNIEMKGKRVTDHCIDSKSKTFHGDQWVRVDVLVLGDSIIKHIAAGDTVLVYEKPQIGDGNVANYNASEKIDGKPLKEGYISLQSESHPVEFRKVALVDLAPYAHDPKKLSLILETLRRQSAKKN